jgi:type I restriction enzyme S subunit
MHSAMQQIISEIGEHKRHWISEYQNNTIDIPNVFEQEAIASKIMEWQERISGLEAEIERMGELKKGLMQQIFSGKLRFKNEDGNDFPAWESKKLGDVTGDFDNQRKPVKGLDRVKGQYPYYGANGVVDYVKDYIFDGEYVLLAEDGVVDISNYPVHYVNGKFWANNHAHILKGHENILDNSYLYYALQNIGFHKYITGSAQTKLNGKVLKTIYVPIPCVTEQQKIATFLSDLNFQITALKSLCDETAKQKKWLLNNLVTGKIRLPRFDDKSEESKKNTEEVGNE